MGVPVFRERKRLLDVLARGQLGGDRQVPDVQQRSHRPTARLRDVRSTRQGSRMNLAAHIGFAPQIQNGFNAHDQFGAQIDMRQVYLTVGGEGGRILAGRELGLFQRENILNDQTLFGVGAVGGVQGFGTTLGRSGYGYIYPNFNAQLTYSSAAKNPAQISVGLFQPSAMPNGYTQTTLPRVETEV